MFTCKKNKTLFLLYLEGSTGKYEADFEDEQGKCVFIPNFSTCASYIVHVYLTCSGKSVNILLYILGNMEICIMYLNIC